MSSFGTGFSNYTLIFFDQLTMVIGFIPTKLFKPLRVLGVLLCLASCGAAVHLLDATRVAEAFERSVRAMAFHGYHALPIYLIHMVLKLAVMAYFLARA